MQGSARLEAARSSCDMRFSSYEALNIVDAIPVAQRPSAAERSTYGPHLHRPDVAHSLDDVVDRIVPALGGRTGRAGGDVGAIRLALNAAIVRY